MKFREEPRGDSGDSKGDKEIAYKEEGRGRGEKEFSGKSDDKQEEETDGPTQETF